MAEEETQLKEEEPEVKEEEKEVVGQGSETDGEPGGDDPQAVRARKEYRARKRAEEENQELKQTLYKLQGQVETLAAQTAKKQEPSEREWTSEQILKAIDDGKIEETPEIRAEIRRRQKNEIAQEVLSGVLNQTGRIKAIESAQKMFDSYREAIPALDNRNSKEYGAVIEEMKALVASGLENNIVTQTLAVKAAMGPIEKYQKRRDSDRFSRENRETMKEVGGGERPEEISHSWKKGIPTQQLAYWESRGYSEKEQKKLAEHYTPPRRRSE